MSIREKFEVPKRYNTISIALMLLGIIAIVALYMSTHGSGGTPEERIYRTQGSGQACCKTVFISY
ncbi:MAG: hypothetical protein IPP72_16680 [Chitinophagaceae bacterium]|nr:hypothetical protein [Chitinophagaceae bacterium]